MTSYGYKGMLCPFLEGTGLHCGQSTEKMEREERAILLFGGAGFEPRAKIKKRSRCKQF